MLKIFAIIGRKGAGRAEVLLSLVAHLKNRGYRVGVVRHLKREDLEIDQPGKDTYEYRMQGAEKVILSGRKRCAIFENRDEELSVTELLETFDGYDFVFFEEYLLPHVPTIEVHKKAAGDLISGSSCALIAICSDSFSSENSKETPVYSFHQAGLLADFLEHFHATPKTEALLC
jgi:molybdopterin-guanine dinucleotide biosynthesis protein MobB